MGSGTVTAARRKPLLNRVLLAAGNPLEWSPVDKAFFAAAMILPFVVWYWLCEYAWVSRRVAADYFDVDFMWIVLKVQTILIIGWTGIGVAALWLRRRNPENRVLAFIGLQLYALGFGFASYYLGPYTSPFGGIVGLVGGVVGMLLFGPTIALWGLASFLAIVLSTTIAEQARFIPYAPLLHASPAADGHLGATYLYLIGVPLYGVFALGVVLAFYILESWRARDATIEQTSEQLARANDVISRYVASQIAQQILAGNHDFLGRHERRKLTLFFSDIKDFADIADHVEPEDLSGVLNEYLAEMAAVAERHGGTIDKFVGDAIMIVFGAPTATNDRDHALRAVVMALEMQERLAELCAKWARDGFDRAFEVRIGINTGQATIGSFGSRTRLDYTAIGRQVNLAARLQASCTPGRVLISHSTWVLVSDAITCEAKGEIQVKGFQNPVRVYEVTGAERQISVAATSRSA